MLCETKRQFQEWNLKAHDFIEYCMQITKIMKLEKWGTIFVPLMGTFSPEEVMGLLTGLTTLRTPLSC